MLIAGEAFRESPKTRNALWIFGDMRQSAPPVDIEHALTVPSAAALRTAEHANLIADLSGVDVYVLGVHGAGRSVHYWQSLRDFWATYFEKCHANLREFSMMRDVRDFAPVQYANGSDVKDAR